MRTAIPELRTFDWISGFSVGRPALWRELGPFFTAAKRSTKNVPSGVPYGARCSATSSLLSTLSPCILDRERTQRLGLDAVFATRPAVTVTSNPSSSSAISFAGPLSLARVYKHRNRWMHRASALVSPVTSTRGAGPARRDSCVYRPGGPDWGLGPGVQAAVAVVTWRLTSRFPLSENLFAGFPFLRPLPTESPFAPFPPSLPTLTFSTLSVWLSGRVVGAISIL